ncbi:hypothetical protein HMPREF9081_1849 [Centipeda periodontii DSM 2778]|uniref:Uncharacterized protein n=1 Tax=Centipeda periodontii DSM 2778 TaxID=888060 RepID=F5RNL3_9FIRM|nr:hypothetical protein HMPREF9081_1849 [Centipeda periodontii DSM 2778]
MLAQIRRTGLISPALKGWALRRIGVERRCRIKMENRMQPPNVQQ